MSRPAGLWLHAVVAALAMLGGLLLVGLGALLKIRDPLHNIKLQYVDGSSVINKFLSVAVVSMIAGGILVFASLLGIWVARTKSLRIVTIPVYIMVLLIIIGSLTFIAAVVLLLAKGKSPLGIRSGLEKAWLNTVAVGKDDACRLQADFECFGFNDNFCEGCGAFNANGVRTCSEEQAPQCPICPETLPTTTQGCYGAILNATQGYYSPIGISSAAVAGLLLFDAVIVCAL